MTTSMPAAPRGERDDAVRPELKWVGVVVLVVLVAASVLLYLLPTHSGTPTDSLLEPARFAWPVKPEMTAMFMGACYGAGAYFFFRVSFGGSWHAVAAYFPGIAVFAWLMGISTFLHWEKFNHAHVAFFAWFLLYVATPFIVPLLYVRNRGADPGVPDIEDAVVPAGVRRLVGAGGAALLVVAAVMYVAPAVAIDLWPWTLTELTSRVVAAFLSASGVAALLVSRDGRWSAWKVFVRSAVLAAALLLLASARAWHEFDSGNPLSYAFLGSMGALVAGGLALDGVMSGRAGRRGTRLRWRPARRRAPKPH